MRHYHAPLGWLRDLCHAATFKRLSFVPIIMLSATDEFNDRVRARMVGATDYLTKPFARY